MGWTPAAEIDLDEMVLRSLVADQHPDLAHLPLVRLDAGWDNEMWRLGSDLLLRLPRRQAAAALIENEIRWLPTLAPALSIPVPAPLRVGRPSSTFPWSWTVVAWRDGTPADDSRLARPEAAAAQLGRFLAELHRPAPPDAPLNPVRGGTLAGRSQAMEDRLAALGREVDSRRVRRVWEAAAAAPFHPGPPLWLHGDLHPANILLAGDRVAAVVDFGDICRGDPATDLGAVLMLLPRPSWGLLSTAYGGLSPELRLRSLGWALLMGIFFIGIGLEGKASYGAVGRRTVSRVLAAFEDTA